MTKFFNWSIKIPIYLLVFLVPLFWLPFSFEAFEFNKIYLISFLVSFSFLAWLARMVLVEKEIRFRKSPLDIPVLFFLLIATLSALFSVDKNFSLFGFYGRFSDGLILLLSSGVFYFLLTNNLSLKKEKGQISLESILNLFFFSTFLVVLISYLSIFRIWQKIPHLPPIMKQRTFNPVFGSLEGLTVFLSLALVFLVGRILTQENKGKLWEIFYYLLAFATLGLLIIFDFNSSWIILIGGLGSFLVLALATRMFRENVNQLLLPIFFIIVAFGFLIFSSQSLFHLSFPKEQILKPTITWKVALAAMKENPKSWFLGSGIGTFHYDFAKFKPKEFNQNPRWPIRYDRASSYLSEILGTMGSLGIISYFVLISIFFLICWFLIFLEKNPKILVFFSTLFAFFLSHLLYYQTATLTFTFWLVLGLGVISWQKPLSEKTLSFKNFPELRLIFSTLLIVFFLGILTFYFFGIKFYLADTNYLQALKRPLEERIKFLEKTVSLNPHSTYYRIALARTYLAYLSNELAKPLGKQNQEKIKNFSKEAFDQAKRATELSPNEVTSWETLAMVYRDIQALAGSSATKWAINSFEKAIKLEPKNPVLYTELGKLYLNSDLKKAEEYFKKARELKPDYLEAVFQLGVVYFNQGKTDKAISQFKKALSIYPNYSNALYSLGVAYAKKGEKEKAISYFERVLKLNPGNQDVINKLKELKGKE